jgi:hypothetical protein
MLAGRTRSRPAVWGLGLRARVRDYDSTSTTWREPTAVENRPHWVDHERTDRTAVHENATVGALVACGAVFPGPVLSLVA